MKLAVKLYGVNSVGLPPVWPSDVLQLDDQDPIPVGYTEMSLSVYNDYLAEHQAEYDAAIAILALADRKAARIAELTSAITAFIQSHYVGGDITLLLSLYVEALAVNYPQRITLIQSALTWINQVMAALRAAKTAIAACSTIEQINAVTVDFALLNSTDPEVTVDAATDLQS